MLHYLEMEMFVRDMNSFKYIMQVLQKVSKPDIIPLQGQYLPIYRQLTLSPKDKKGLPKRIK